ncbi:unnamed protein product [Rotaria sordida]|uniref:GYF domain-containing protein n=1 Tax=Rotaria sordida TaxID=392033 RepID=A0A818XVS0_9BILA|nr:unnamed protein product [Rotaria sordida]CAF3744930.1 unnamed protein product [Rotaria sordida]
MERKRKIVSTTDIETDQTSKKQKKLPNESENTRLHSGKYTLDSDEDDDEQDNAKTMNQDDLDDIGQEKATIGFDDEVKITPFNIEEEMEEGHYDESGCFQWRKKDKDEVHDAWLDEIDWTNVKNYKLKNSQTTEENPDDPSKMNSSNDDEDDDETNDNQFNEANTLKSILAIMQPNETVVRAIKRLGAAATSNKSKQRIKQRKPLPGEIPTASPVELTSEELKKNKLLLEEMTGLADQFVSNGQLDIYQETYEQLKKKLDRLQSSASSSTNNPTFDMYADSDITASITSSTLSNNKNDSSTTLWEYTTDNNSTIQGPFTTEQMIRLTNIEGKLDKDKVRCRRVGTEQFYSIKRIDFDLYLD